MNMKMVFFRQLCKILYETCSDEIVEKVLFFDAKVSYTNYKSGLKNEKVLIFKEHSGAKLGGLAVGYLVVKCGD